MNYRALSYLPTSGYGAWHRSTNGAYYYSYYGSQTALPSTYTFKPVPVAASISAPTPTPVSFTQSKPLLPSYTPQPYIAPTIPITPYVPGRYTPVENPSAGASKMAYYQYGVYGNSNFNTGAGDYQYTGDGSWNNGYFYYKSTPDYNQSVPDSVYITPGQFDPTITPSQFDPAITPGQNFNPQTWEGIQQSIDQSPQTQGGVWNWNASRGYYYYYKFDPSSGNYYYYGSGARTSVPSGAASRRGSGASSGGGSGSGGSPGAPPQQKPPQQQNQSPIIPITINSPAANGVPLWALNAVNPMATAQPAQFHTISPPVTISRSPTSALSAHGAMPSQSARTVPLDNRGTLSAAPLDTNMILIVAGIGAFVLLMQNQPKG